MRCPGGVSEIPVARLGAMPVPQAYDIAPPIHDGGPLSQIEVRLFRLGNRLR